MDNTVENIELHIEQAKKFIRNSEALSRLSRDPDFVRLILEGYFEEESKRLVLVKADPAMADTEKQTNILSSIDAIGHFHQYLHTVSQLGEMARKGIMDDEAAREEILRETV